MESSVGASATIIAMIGDTFWSILADASSELEEALRNPDIPVKRLLPQLILT